MKILLIDTCGATGSVALSGATHPPASASLPGRSAAERLIPSIQALASSSGIRLDQLDAVAVVHGPGSFTGVRVGLSAAKGLCHALNLPLVAISRLAVLASLAGPPARVPHSSRPDRDGWGIHALLDAGRGEFYSGLFADGLCLREALLTRDRLLASVDLASVDLAAVDLAAANSAASLAGRGREQQQSFVVCEPAVAQSLVVLVPQLVAEPTAADALPIALARIQQRAFDDSATIDANYLRRTDAEIFAKPIAAAQPRATHSRSSAG